MRLPTKRGPLSAACIDALSGDPGTLGAAAVLDLLERRPADLDPVADEDLQLTLWLLYELHYRGFEDVPETWEWDPDLLRVRQALERVFEADLRRRAQPHVEAALGADGDVATRLFELAGSFDGPPVAGYLQREATLEQYREFLVHRSIYHLKESDPHSWVIPRIGGKPKVALVELQYDEYGAGRADRLHSTMFGDTLEACGLDRTYGAYLDAVPAPTLAQNNAMSLFGLHRRLHAADLGNLGAFEATSSLPCRRYAGGLRRLGMPEEAAAYFDEHVEADAVHEQLAFRDVCAELVREEPDRLADVFLGAVVCLELDAVAGAAMLDAWHDGRSSLRAPDPQAVAS
jgi:hypothetical protein